MIWDWTCLCFGNLSKKTEDVLKFTVFDRQRNAHGKGQVFFSGGFVFAKHNGHSVLASAGNYGYSGIVQLSKFDQLRQLSRRSTNANKT